MDNVVTQGAGHDAVSKGMRLGMRPWITRTLLVAMTLSVLVHLATVFSEQLYALALGLMGEKIEVRETDRQLTEQEIEAETLPQAGLPTKPLINKLNVYLVPAQQLKATTSKPKPKQPRTVVPKKAQPTQLAQQVPTTESFPVPTEPVMLPPEPTALVIAQPEPVQLPVPETPVSTTVATAPPVVPSTPVESVASEVQAAPVSSKAFPRDMRVHYTALGLGEATLSWRQEGNVYTVELRAAGLGKSMLGRAKGTVTKAGLRPDEYQEFRDGKLDTPKYVVLFDWNANTVSFGDPQSLKREPINPGAQDILSLYFQVALRGSKAMDAELQIITGKKLYTQRYHIEGESTVHIPGAGDVNAVLVKGQNERGRGDFWLAPDWYNLPVKVNLDMSGKLIVPLDVTKVEVAGKVMLSRPKPAPPRPKRDR
ncbi:DUF3108 domain-containing protein [Chitinivorax sp. B]|uniref:DUF3108 domain-containing protein n=1 Tax=Chitinivorax sp. B TaxID=2502235 RepID=UPI0014852220|nr:DUF3108 domain-containing protein [Chitinivorax sp. B]